MCFTVSQQKKGVERFIKAVDEIYADHQNKINFNQVQDNYLVSGFQYPELVVLKEDEINSYRWGLIPYWTKDNEGTKKIRSMTLNARCETVFEKPSFRSAIKTQRCVLPVNGFFEWKEVNKEKIPYYIFPKENELFYLGCLYDSWTDRETGAISNTFSIITVPANLMMRDIHNSGQNKHRMPLIISEKNIVTWNDTTLKKDSIEMLMKPYNEKQMDAYTITKKANYSRENRNVPEIIDPLECI